MIVHFENVLHERVKRRQAAQISLRLEPNTTSYGSVSNDSGVRKSVSADHMEIRFGNDVVTRQLKKDLGVLKPGHRGPHPDFIFLALLMGMLGSCTAGLTSSDYSNGGWWLAAAAGFAAALVVFKVAS